MNTYQCRISSSAASPRIRSIASLPAPWPASPRRSSSSPRSRSRTCRTTATTTTPPIRRSPQAFKAAIAAVDAVLFVTPEYNRSIPGALKNAIDWASRPYGKNSFARKPSAVIGTSPGKIGTAVGQQHLRSILAFCNSPLMNSIEAYIQFEKGLITDEGEVTNAETAKFLRNYMTELHCFIVRCYMVLPRNVGTARNDERQTTD